MEVKKQFSIDDLADAHEVLDMREDAERQAQADAQRQRGSI